MTVFPGGGVDPQDASADVAWAGPPVSWWAERFGVDESRAKALVCAAVRETFEECGVLLAGPTADTVVADTSGYAQARKQLESRELSFSEFIANEGLVLRADLLRPWANWITPVGESRRYDTRFFVAAAPEGQTADGETSEAASVAWQTPEEALTDCRENDPASADVDAVDLARAVRFGRGGTRRRAGDPRDPADAVPGGRAAEGAVPGAGSLLRGRDPSVEQAVATQAPGWDERSAGSGIRDYR
jgi:8-oxo-dGTP pyrophosphatase MutT (NUDIX family)